MKNGRKKPVTNSPSAARKKKQRRQWCRMLTGLHYRNPEITKYFSSKSRNGPLLIAALYCEGKSYLKHAMMSQNWTRIGPMPPASRRFWSSSGKLRHVSFTVQMRIKQTVRGTWCADVWGNTLNCPYIMSNIAFWSFYHHFKIILARVSWWKGNVLIIMLPRRYWQRCSFNTSFTIRPCRKH